MTAGSNSNINFFNNSHNTETANNKLNRPESGSK